MKNKYITNICNDINFQICKSYRQYKYKNLLNNDISIVSNNCLGGILYHEIGQKFLSPTINLWFENNDYLRFLENLNNIQHLELHEYFESNTEHPLGYLSTNNNEKIVVRFTHYTNFKQAKKKWDARCKRINFDNLYILFETPIFYKSINKMDYDTALNQFRKFYELPFANKMFISGSTTPKTKISKRLKLYDSWFPGKILETKQAYFSSKLNKKYYDDINFKKFLSKKHN